MSLIKLTGLAFAAVFIVQTAGANAAQIFGDANRGKDIAAKWCVGCHYSSGAMGNDGAPPLRTVAVKGAKAPGFFRVFLVQPHKPMPPLHLSNQEIEDVIAYLAQLATEKQQ